MIRGGASPIVDHSDGWLRPSRAEVDLSAIVENYAAIENLVGGPKVLAVVKADAYGHGAVPVARALSAAGAFGFGVALAEEAFELRESGVTGDIIVLNGVYGASHREVLKADITPVVYGVDQVQAFASAAAGRRFNVHLKIDTGMARLGVRLEDLEAFLQSLASIESVQVEGVLTHLASAGTDPSFAGIQLQRFRLALDKVRQAGHRPRFVHAANSAGCFLTDARFDLVRPGIALYGVNPVGPAIEEPSLRLALRIRSEIIAMRRIGTGESVGYDQTWEAPRPGAVIATVPFGYGDGLMWRTSGCLDVLVQGVRCPIVGRVSMDLVTIDVTSAPGAEIGSDVVLLGNQGADTVRPEEWAAAAETSPYEVFTNISRRVPRVFSSPPGDS